MSQGLISFLRTADLTVCFEGVLGPETMTAKRRGKKREKGEEQIDVLVELLLDQAWNEAGEQVDMEKLKEQILREAEIVARWKKKPFYVA